MPSRRPPLAPLTAFRFLAALAVLLHHLSPLLGADARLSKLVPYCYEGFAGVTFFFVLSGFILAYNYHDQFGVLRLRKIWNFYVARGARVYPLHFLAFLAVLPLTYPALREAPAEALLRAIPNLTLTHAFFPDKDYYISYNGVSWSLSAECFFYAVLPLLLWGLVSLRLIGPLRSAGCLLLTWGFTLAVVWCLRDHPQVHWLCYINPLFRVADFFVGVLLGQVFLGSAGTRMLRWGPRTATALELASVGGLAVATHYAPAVPLPLRFGPYYTLLMGLIILVYAVRLGYLSRLLSCRVLSVLGEISFGFYLFHFLVIYYVSLYGGWLGVTALTPRVVSLLSLLGTLAVSLACHYAYERPLRSLWKRLLTVREKVPGREAGGEAPPRLAEAA